MYSFLFENFPKVVNYVKIQFFNSQFLILNFTTFAAQLQTKIYGFMNRNTLLTLVFSLIFNALYSTPYFYLKIETPSVWTAECALMNAENESRVYKIELNKTTNDARFALEVEDAKFITITYAGESFDIFIEPTDDVQIFFTNNQIKKTLRFEGKGADNNNILSEFQRRFRSDAVSNFKTNFISPMIDEVTKQRASSSDETTY